MKNTAWLVCALLCVWGCDDGETDEEPVLPMGGSPAPPDMGGVVPTGGDTAGLDAAPPPVGGALPGDAAVSPPDIAPLPDAAALPPDASPPPMANCGDLDDLAGFPLVQALHRQMVEDYRPIEPEPDFGGTLNRYTTARFLMFQQVERGLTDAGDAAVECVYTGRTTEIAPDEEPDTRNINCEHTWPRSRMDDDRDAALYHHQQSDIHHLYPTDAEANSHRGSLRFGEPTSSRNLDYTPAVSGLNNEGDPVFMPREERRGDVARVVLYYSIRWGAAIPEPEESVLRAWSSADPPDARERTRNDRIAAVQGNRNPFIDCPQLVDAVDDFGDFPIHDRDLALP